MHSVRINWVSVLRRLIVYKIYELFLCPDKQNCELQTDIRIKRVSVEGGFHCIFFLFPMTVARDHAHSHQGKSPASNL